MTVHVYSASPWVSEAREIMNLRPAWTTSETLCTNKQGNGRTV